MSILNIKITDTIAKKAATITALTIIVGAISGALVWLNNLEEFKEKSRQEIEEINNRLDEKSKTFAVGLRMEEDGNVIYRHFDGEEYNAAYDYDIHKWYFVDKWLVTHWCFEPTNY